MPEAVETADDADNTGDAAAAADTPCEVVVCNDGIGVELDLRPVREPREDDRDETKVSAAADDAVTVPLGPTEAERERELRRRGPLEHQRRRMGH